MVLQLFELQAVQDGSKKWPLFFSVGQGLLFDVYYTVATPLLWLGTRLCGYK